MKKVPKTHPRLLAVNGGGFWGRVLALMCGDGFVVLQDNRDGDRSSAILRLFGAEIPDIGRIQRIYLANYGHELLLIRSFVPLPDSREEDGQWVLELPPVGSQLKIFEDGKESGSRYSAGDTRSKGPERVDPGGGRRAGGHIVQGTLFD